MKSLFVNPFTEQNSIVMIMVNRPIENIVIGEFNTVLSSFTLYRHLGQCCIHLLIAE